MDNGADVAIETHGGVGVRLVGKIRPPANVYFGAEIYRSCFAENLIGGQASRRFGQKMAVLLSDR